jgi:hypothetical protein
MKATLGIVMISLLYGCSGLSMREIEAKALKCDPQESQACARLHERVDRWYEKQRKMKEETCPPGYVLIKDTFGSKCVDTEEVGRWLRGNSPGYGGPIG